MSLALFIEFSDHVLSYIWVCFCDFEDLTITHFDNFVCKPLKTLVMGDHDHSNLVLDIQVHKNLHNNVC